MVTIKDEHHGNTWSIGSTYDDSGWIYIAKDGMLIVNLAVDANRLAELIRDLKATYLGLVE